MKRVQAILAAMAFSTASFAAVTPAFAEKPAVYTAPFSRLAVGGYDLIAYFTDNRPVQGSANFSVMHGGFEYRFASAGHRDAFQANPARYLPQYGGYCAWAVSQGRTASGDPRYWRIVDGKLYLNYNAGIQTRWERDIPGFIHAADANWPGVLR